MNYLENDMMVFVEVEYIYIVWYSFIFGDVFNRNVYMLIKNCV